MPAHSLVLTTQSGYFEEALGVGLAESETREIRFTKGNAYAYQRVFENINLSSKATELP